MTDYDDHDDCDEGPACCKSCGVPFVDHLGVQATCAMLQETRQRMQDNKQPEMIAAAQKILSYFQASKAFGCTESPIDEACEFLASQYLAEASKPFVTPNVQAYLQCVSHIHVDGDESAENEKDVAWDRLTKTEQSEANAIVQAVFGEWL